jgi:hypothetical protein
MKPNKKEWRNAHALITNSFGRLPMMFNNRNDIQKVKDDPFIVGTLSNPENDFSEIPVNFIGSHTVELLENDKEILKLRSKLSEDLGILLIKINKQNVEVVYFIQNHDGKIWITYIVFFNGVYVGKTVFYYIAESTNLGLLFMQDGSFFSDMKKGKFNHFVIKCLCHVYFNLSL